MRTWPGRHYSTPQRAGTGARWKLCRADFDPRLSRVLERVLTRTQADSQSPSLVDGAVLQVRTRSHTASGVLCINREG